MIPMRLLRLLALAIAIAVPIQGMAAVAAGQCMAFGHHEQDPGNDSDPHAGQDAHGHEGHSHASDDGGDAGGHCGPCVACCASASIAGPSALPVVSSSSNIKYVLSQAAPPGIELHRLDRPPLPL